MSRKSERVDKSVDLGVRVIASTKLSHHIFNTRIIIVLEDTRFIKTTLSPDFIGKLATQSDKILQDEKDISLNTANYYHNKFRYTFAILTLLIGQFEII